MLYVNMHINIKYANLWAITSSTELVSNRPIFFKMITSLATNYSLQSCCSFDAAGLRVSVEKVREVGTITIGS